MELPSDFDILWPSSATMKPCVTTSRNGGRSRVPRPDEQRALEPAAMLIASLEVHVRRPRQLAAERQHRLVARSGVEPDVQNVALALELGAATGRAGESVRNEFRERALVPRVGAIDVEHAGGAFDELGCQQRLAALHAVDGRDRERPRRADARCTSRADSRSCCRCDRVPTTAPSAPGCRSHPAPLCAAMRPVCVCSPDFAAPSSGASIAMNHCDVARKMTGLWQRQQCGYAC